MIVSGDQNDDGFKSTTEGMPWVALPLTADKSNVEKKVPCTGYPTPGIVRNSDGKVLAPDVFGKVNEGSLTECQGLANA